MDKTAVEHVALDGLKRYIEDVIEYSDSLAEVHNDVYTNQQNIEDNHIYAMDHINDEYDRLQSEMQNQIDELKQTEKDNYSYAMEHINRLASELDGKTSDFKSMDNDLKDYIDVLEERIEELENLVKELQK
tara:strand:+ start:431 stop:823 length:393 start_codon:yes stop_codon:yes gene_type:complete